MYYIGIDIGTSSICGIVYDAVNKTYDSVTKQNTAHILSPLAWERIQNPSIIMDIVNEIICLFTAQYPDIKAIGVTGQMHGILYIDEHGNALTPLYTWQDGRGSQLFINNLTYSQYLTELTNYRTATGYGLVTHFYNQKNNLVPCNAVKLCTIMDYAVMKLSKTASPIIDYTNGAALGFFDTEKLCFDTEALTKVGIDASFLPELKPSGAFAGLHQGSIPVFSAIGDNQASFIGSVSDIPHSVHITIGTSSQISVYSEKYTAVPSLDTRPLPGGGYILVGAALCGGQSFAVLKDFFEATLKFFGTKTSGNLQKLIFSRFPSELPDLYDIMTTIPVDAADELPITETLFNGTRSEPSKKGSISNISTTNFTPQNLIISFLKGISDELHNFFLQLPDEIRQNKTILVGAGNGITKNPLLINIIEQQFNCNMTLSPQAEVAALGACLFVTQPLILNS
ncbi:MAG: hypothetical protein LBD53_04110 [Tannerella sp.]|jgi:sedoheptulokinase|nr:hypothetical protein [Tannerella sp.]